MRPETVRRVAPLAVAVLVLLVIAGVWAVRRGAGPVGGGTPGAGSTADGPPVLRLVGWMAATSDTADPRYNLAPNADLPAGPGSDPVHRLAPEDVEAATNLVGTVVHEDAGPTAGWLQRGAPGPAYPLITASEAYDALVRTPLPMPLMACPEPLPPGTDPVPCGGPVTVTGARLGLSVQRTVDAPLLVPAWLFDVQGSPNPLVQLAVDPALLQPAQDTGGGSGGSGGSVTGSPGTAVPPAPPSAQPGPPDGSRFTSVTRSADDRSLEVSFYGGVPECYSYSVHADETDAKVQLSVVEKRTAGDKPCIDLAVQINETVRLAAPLGLRTVVDSETGVAVLGPRK
jgi:hypothetical protein